MKHFDQYIQYRALAFKYGSGAYQTHDTIQKLIDAGGMTGVDDKGNPVPISDAEQVLPYELKNLCAKVPADLVDEIDNTVGLLRISKREFVEMAVRDALERANEICKELDIFEFHANSSEENA